MAKQHCTVLSDQISDQSMPGPQQVFTNDGLTDVVMMDHYSSLDVHAPSFQIANLRLNDAETGVKEQHPQTKLASATQLGFNVATVLDSRSLSGNNSPREDEVNSESMTGIVSKSISALLDDDNYPPVNHPAQRPSKVGNQTL